MRLTGAQQRSRATAVTECARTLRTSCSLVSVQIGRMIGRFFKVKGLE